MLCHIQVCQLEVLNKQRPHSAGIMKNLAEGKLLMSK